MFNVPRDRDGSRCPVLACDWRHAQPLHSEGVMALLSGHMVEAHPKTEWARREMARRAGGGLDTRRD